jgi:hypothetical protein
VVIRTTQNEHGLLTLDLAVAIGIFVSVLLPLSGSYLLQQKQARSCYYRALATGIVDGEMEALAAGEWRVFAEGEQDYAVNGEAVQNLPAGKFMFIRKGNQLRLEWRPDKNIKLEPVMREAQGR